MLIQRKKRTVDIGPGFLTVVCNELFTPATARLLRRKNCFVFYVQRFWLSFVWRTGFGGVYSFGLGNVLALVM